MLSNRQPPIRRRGSEAISLTIAASIRRLRSRRPRIKLQIVDSHAHLESADFDADRAAMLARAKAAGVEAILAIGSGGSGPDRLDAAMSVAANYDWIYATVGIHPHDAALATEDITRSSTSWPNIRKVIAWGEIGLDYHYDQPAARNAAGRFSPPARQARAPRNCPSSFIAATPGTIAWRSRAGLAPTGLGGIFHCFTGTAAEAARPESTWDS